MATYTADSIGPRVVVPGGLIINDTDYLGDGSATFKAGDLIRITTSGTVKLAGLDSDTAGSVHGMILKDVDSAVSTALPVALFTEKTVLRIQCYDATGPASYSVGQTYTLRRGAAGKHSITTTTTKGIATVFRQPSYDNVADINLAQKAYGFIDVKFARSIIDGRAA